MTPRRDFLAFTVGAVAAGTVLSTVAGADAAKGGQLGHPADPDADLLALCAKFHAQHALTTQDGTDDEWVAYEAAMVVKWGISDEIESIAPKTPVGLCAKASVAVILIDECHGPDIAGCADRFALAVLRAVAGDVVA